MRRLRCRQSLLLVCSLVRNLTQNLAPGCVMSLSMTVTAVVFEPTTRVNWSVANLRPLSCLKGPARYLAKSHFPKTNRPQAGTGGPPGALGHTFLYEAT